MTMWTLMRGVRETANFVSKFMSRVESTFNQIKHNKIF